MAEVAFAVTQQAYCECPVKLRVAEASARSKQLSVSAILVGALLITLQVADGMLTFLGVTQYGLAMEGNPILRELMHRFGHLETLIFLKISASLVVVWLIYSTREIPWVKKILGLLCCVYVFAAILPWTYILFIHPVM